MLLHLLETLRLCYLGGGAEGACGDLEYNLSHFDVAIDNRNPCKDSSLWHVAIDLSLHLMAKWRNTSMYPDQAIAILYIVAQWNEKHHVQA